VVVAEDGTDMGYVPTVTNVATGLYKAEIAATSGNGFEAGRRYNLYATATVGGITGRDGIGEFEVLAVDLNTGVASVTGAVGSVTGLTAANLDVAVSTRLATASYTAPDNASIAAILVDTAEIGVAGAGLTNINLPDQTMDITGNLSGSVGSVTGLTAANLDVAVSSRLATAGYTAPDNASITTILSDTNDIQTRLPAALVGGRMASIAEVVGDKTGYSLATAPLDAAGIRAAMGLASANLDTQLGTLLPTSGYTAPDNASITAIKIKTDSLAFTVAGQVDANIKYVNDVGVTGDGQSGTEWGPV